MAESLDLSVVAEGVEDEATLVLLREMGAGQAQGYYFAKPMAQEALLATYLAGHQVHQA
jgi:EAL domain-containing protein (putative c-di-GMP-specific phosphodiesterase class I)